MRKLALILLIPVVIDAATTRRSVEKVPLNEKPKTSTSNSNSQEVDENYVDGSWECGGEEFSKLVSFQSISNDCPKLLNPVNNCCLAHDRCYELQQGQAHCDKVFCGCLTTVTYSTDNSTYICHTQHSKSFCALVEDFGSSFYEASVNTTEVSEDGERTSTFIKTTLNKTEEGPHVRIYESKIHETEQPIEGLPTLDTLN